MLSLLPLLAFIQDREFRSYLSYWLGLPLHNDHFICPKCHNTADPFRDHQVGCGGNGDQISCHNAIKDIIFNAAQSAPLGPSKETLGLMSQSSSCPADVLLPNWSNGRLVTLDVHVISPLQSLTLSEAAFSQDYAVQVGVQRKHAANLPNCRSSGLA